MRSRTANWFLCKIRYEKIMDDGLQKKVTEQYVVDGLSFTEAEARIIDQMSQQISGEFEVLEIDRCAFKEVFFSDMESADKWYKSKLQFITIDEKTAKEKKDYRVLSSTGQHSGECAQEHRRGDGRYDDRLCYLLCCRDTYHGRI